MGSCGSPRTYTPRVEAHDAPCPLILPGVINYPSRSNPSCATETHRKRLGAPLPRTRRLTRPTPAG